jgi:intracellular sulfur oxidation DsrE/DsrF family protein
MKKFLGNISTALVVLVFVAMTPAYAEVVHKLAIQISDSDPKTMTKALNVVANAARAFGARGEEVKIEVVAYNAGLHILRSDTSPVAKRITGMSESLHNVTFTACGNTIKGMTKKEGKAPPIMAFANHVPGGVIRLMELDNMGYTIIRP